MAQLYKFNVEKAVNKPEKAHIFTAAKCICTFFSRCYNRVYSLQELPKPARTDLTRTVPHSGNKALAKGASAVLKMQCAVFGSNSTSDTFL